MSQLVEPDLSQLFMARVISVLLHLGKPEEGHAHDCKQATVANQNQNAHN